MMVMVSSQWWWKWWALNDEKYDDDGGDENDDDEGDDDDYSIINSYIYNNSYILVNNSYILDNNSYILYNNSYILYNNSSILYNNSSILDPCKSVMMIMMIMMSMFRSVVRSSSWLSSSIVWVYPRSVLKCFFFYKVKFAFQKVFYHWFPYSLPFKSTALLPVMMCWACLIF